MNTDFPEHFFQRPDESADEKFYSQPRFVTHIDDATISCLTDFYREQIASGSRVLDLMSSWISHLPEDVDYAHVSGHGMNAAARAHACTPKDAARRRRQAKAHRRAVWPRREKAGKVH